MIQNRISNLNMFFICVHVNDKYLSHLYHISMQTNHRSYEGKYAFNYCFQSSLL